MCVHGGGGGGGGGVSVLVMNLSWGQNTSLRRDVISHPNDIITLSHRYALDGCTTE